MYIFESFRGFFSCIIKSGEWPLSVATFVANEKLLLDIAGLCYKFSGEKYDPNKGL